MPRTARRQSATGIYHIIVQGINRQTVFTDEDDNEKYLQTLADCKKISGFKIYGYCLMGNHAHLLIKVNKEGIEQIFRRIGARYVYWYNWKYRRSGHLFQDRFRSEPVENDAYLITVLRYIHRNPLKAGLCQQPEEYKWSSYRDYMTQDGITDSSFALDLIGKEEFINYTSQKNDDLMLDAEEQTKRLTDSELSELIFNTFSLHPMMIQNEPKDKKEELLKAILKIEGTSTRQLSRITGISANTIWKL